MRYQIHQVEIRHLNYSQEKLQLKYQKNIKIYLAKYETSARLECKYAVKTDIDQSQIKNLQQFPLYLDCQNNHYEVDLLGTSTNSILTMDKK